MKYVNRDEIIKAVKEAMGPMDYPSELRDSIARTIVSAAESIDIVRCNDCVHKWTIDCPMDEQYDDDYCSYGERKEDNAGQDKGYSRKEETNQEAGR